MVTLRYMAQRWFVLLESVEIPLELEQSLLMEWVGGRYKASWKWVHV